jgi:hypothetical protein
MFMLMFFIDFRQQRIGSIATMASGTCCNVNLIFHMRLKRRIGM